MMVLICYLGYLCGTFYSSLLVDEARWHGYNWGRAIVVTSVVFIASAVIPSAIYLAYTAIRHGFRMLRQHTLTPTHG